MVNSIPLDEAGQVRSWLDASSRPEIEAEIEVIHLEIARAIREVGPHCLASGNCCRFEAHGHRLYATGLEVARCVLLCREEGRDITVGDIESAVEQGNCPWQDGRLCTARRGRPTGCRVYFCDPRLQDLVPDLAEDAHREIRAIHDRFNVPYAYGEWRTMLRDILTLAPPLGPAAPGPVRTVTPRSGRGERLVDLRILAGERRSPRETGSRRGLSVVAG